MKKLLFTIMFSLILVIISYSQDFMVFNTYNTSTTLPHHQVNEVAFDSQGTVWFGTDNGIAKFNGSTWTTICQDYCQSLAADQNGNIWYPNILGVITRFDGTSFTTFPELTETKKAIAVTADNAGNIWFACNNLVLKYDGQNWTSLIPGFYGIRSIAIDSQGHIWLGGEEGVATYNGSTWFFYYSLGLYFKQSTYRLAFDNQGYTWAGTLNGAMKLKGNQASIINIPFTLSPPSNCIYDVAVDANNSVYFGTRTGGVKKLSGNTWSSFSTADGLISNYVKSLIFDQNGQLWIGTEDGVSVMNGSNFTNYTNNGLKSNYVSSTYRDEQDRLWFTTSKGVSVLNANSWYTFRRTDGLAGDTVLCVDSDYAGNLWFGTQNDGLSKFDGTSWTTLNTYSGIPSNKITCIATDLENTIWFGTSTGGLCSYDGNNVRTYNTSNSGLVSNNVSDIRIDDYGNVWVTGYNGVSVYDGLVWRNFTRSASFLNKNFTRLAFDSYRQLWVTTSDELLLLSGSTFIRIEYPGIYFFSPQPAFDASNKLFLSCGANLFTYQNQSWATIGEYIMEGMYLFPHSLYIDKYGYKWKSFSKNGVTRIDDGGVGPLESGRIILRGVVFNDLNGNGIRESDEPGLPQQLISYDNQVTSTANEGYFSVRSEAGNHNVLLNLQPNWQYTTDSLQSIYLINGVMPDTIYFGIRAINNIDDVAISLTGTRVIINRKPVYWIDYKNNGSIAESGYVELKLDSNLIVLTTVPDYTSISGNTLSWEVEDMVPGEERQIYILCDNAPFESFGDSLISKVNISILNPDIHLEDNSESLIQIVTGPYDPNDKQVSPEGIGVDHKVLFGQELTYTIRFQNTGTDTAMNVVIQDTINSIFNLGSFRFIASSHPVKVNIKRPNILSFVFENIFLPDSNVNLEASNGFVKFTIKPYNGLDENTLVENSAAIYFDFNPPVITNKVTSTYVSHIISTPEIMFIKASVYPNPFIDKLKISFQNPGDDPFTLTLITMQGTIVERVEGIRGKEIILEKGYLAAGTYFFKLVNMITGEMAVGKVMKNQSK